MTNDRHLLEMAAKAVGLKLEGDLYSNPGPWVPMYYEGKTYYLWDPLNDNADAFKALSDIPRDMLITFIGKTNEIGIDVLGGDNHWSIKLYEHVDDDRAYSMRRLIVRALAEIGKTMP